MRRVFSTFIKARHGKAQLAAGAILRDPVLCAAFGFGAGLVKFAPGTFGTLVGVAVYLLVMSAAPQFYWAALLVCLALGVWLCGQAAIKLQVHDYGGIVWDEVAGFMVAMVGVPLTWQNVVIAFALFRLFDIVKPWPISWLDRRVGGGFGIMADDVLAGVFAALLMQLYL